MKKLLAFPLVIVSLLLSTPASAQFSPGPFGGIDQCQMTYENPLASILQMMTMTQAMSNMMRPSEAEMIQREIDDLQDHIKDLKSESRDEKRYANAADRKASEAEEQMLQFGCAGGVSGVRIGGAGKVGGVGFSGVGGFATTPLGCLPLAAQRIRNKHKAGAAEDRVQEIKDEIKDAKEEIRDLQKAKANAEAEAPMKQAMRQMQMQQLMQMSAGVPQTSVANLSGLPTSMNSFAGLQGTCPSCMIQPQYGALPTQGILPAAQGIAPILNQVSGIDPYIANQNAQLGFPTLPYTNNFAAGPMGPQMINPPMGGSAFGGLPSGCLNGRPLLPLQIASNNFPGSSLATGSLFQGGAGMIPGSVGGTGSPITPALSGGQVPFYSTGNPQPYAR